MTNCRRGRSRHRRGCLGQRVVPGVHADPPAGRPVDDQLRLGGVGLVPLALAAAMVEKIVINA
jgi:hypothetical protein